MGSNVISSEMAAAKFLKPQQPIKFDEAMRRAMRVPPPPSGKKAKRKVWRKKRR
jgi:hypothetical protein